MAERTGLEPATPGVELPLQILLVLVIQIESGQTRKTALIHFCLTNYFCQLITFVTDVS